MTNFCKDCDIQDHESNLVYQAGGGWRCKFCNANPQRENYFACRCGEWKQEDVKQLYNKQDKCSCPECGIILKSLPLIDGKPIHEDEEYCTCAFASVEEASKKYHWGLGCCQVCENSFTKENLEKIEKFTEERELVDHPSHYQSRKFEVIEIIEEFNLNFNLGNVIKYVLRSGKKGNLKQDLEKARWYLSRQIDSID
jgi:hypothetical protein